MKTVKLNKNIKVRTPFLLESSNLAWITEGKIGNKRSLIIGFNNGSIYAYYTGLQTNSLYVAICSGSVANSQGKTFARLVRNKFETIKLK